MVTAFNSKDEEGEELVLFLERYYEKNLSCEELDAAVNLAIETAKEKANKLGARFSPVRNFPVSVCTYSP